MVVDGICSLFVPGRWERPQWCGKNEKGRYFPSFTIDVTADFAFKFVNVKVSAPFLCNFSISLLCLLPSQPQVKGGWVHRSCTEINV